MRQTIHICNKNTLQNLLVEILAITFHIDKSLLPSQIDKSLGHLITKLKENTWFLIELPYVDKIYRDSYYHYYSSKYGRYNRDCIKVSLFEEKIESADFLSKEKAESISKAYRGFFVIRPTEPSFLGRNIISPNVFNTKPFFYCAHEYESTVNGIKLKVTGFPHSSQDGETISCAETTLWALMNYFGEKYAYYRPITPSQIHTLLRNKISERSIPSCGLTISQISFVLKEMGFGCKIYSKEEFKEAEFFRLLSCYIESGIPLAIGMDDFKAKESNNIGHAVIVIGREEIVNDEIMKMPANINLSDHHSKLLKSNEIDFYDYNDIQKTLIFIDDNQAPYQKGSMKNPVTHYDNEWSNVKIQHFVAPLYPKIYLEAAEAINYIKEFLFAGPNALLPKTEVLLRFFLCSSRSFKNNLAYSDMQPDIKAIILETPLPKFVWIAELSNKKLFIQNKRNGIIVIDATEPSISDNKPLIFAAYQDSIILFDGPNDILTKYSLPLHSYNVFLNNLHISTQ